VGISIGVEGGEGASGIATSGSFSVSFGSDSATDCCARTTSDVVTGGGAGAGGIAISGSSTVGVDSDSATGCCAGTTSDVVAGGGGVAGWFTFV
jgi:hypothetical protein